MSAKPSIIPFPRFSSDSQAYSGITVNLNAVVNNYKVLCDRVFPSRIAAVVKADAYGMGVVPVSRALYLAGCREFFVAYLDEAHELKQGLGAMDVKIYVLNGFFKGSEKEFCEEGFLPVLTDVDKVERWHDFTAHNKKKYPCALHVDTGMHRTGVLPRDFQKILPLLPDLHVSLVMSHLACAEDEHHPMNTLQKERFDEAIQFLNIQGDVRYSLANSGGIFSKEASLRYDVCRPGVGILAGCESQNELSHVLQHTFKVWARIYQIQSVKKGETVGYSCAYEAPSDRKIATVAFGYADGCPWHLSLSDEAHVTVGGHKAPYLGRVSMDLITVDVTDVPEHYLHEGAVVEMIGKDVSVFDMAKWSGTLAYEVMLKFGRRLQKNYIEF